MLDVLSCILHLDQCVAEVVHTYPTWVWAMLFTIIFLETGFVIFPFLPGDSLLFITGTLAATGAFSVHHMVALLLVAAIAGDAVNYYIGKTMGHRMTQPNSPWQRWLKPQYIKQTEEFFEKHGAMAVILGRFAPIIRTFVPFMAGMGHMRYSLFIRYNIIGALLWICGFIYAGYLLGSLPFVKQNIKGILAGIIIVSVLPFAIQIVKAIRHKDK